MQTDFFKNCIKGLLASLLASVILLFVFTWICYTREDPSMMISILGMVALYLSAFIGGFIASRFNRQNGLLSGLATGGVFMLVVIMLSFILRSGKESVGFVTWLLFLLITVVSAVGGYLGVPSGKKRRRKNKKKR